MSLRYSKRDEKEIRQLLKKLNAKVGYYQNKPDYQFKEVLLPTMTVQEFKKGISDRKELNKRKKEIKDFLVKDLKNPYMYVPTKREKERVKKAISVYNKAVSELVKTQKGDALLPEKIKYSEMSKTITSKAKLKEFIKRYEEFSKLKDKGETIKTKSGLTVNKWLYEQTKAAVKEVNAERRKLRELYDKSEAYNEKGEKVTNVSRERLNENLRDIKVDVEDFESKQTFSNFYKAMMKKRNDENAKYQVSYLRDNFRTAVQESNFSADGIREILMQLNSMSDDEFIEKYYANPNLLTPDFIYEQSKLMQFTTTDGAIETEHTAVTAIMGALS